MLPKLQNSSAAGFRADNIASKLIQEDYLKSMLAKSANQDYKPWKNQWAPRNPHSAFGDFPKEYVAKKEPLKESQRLPVYEDSQATLQISTISASHLTHPHMFMCV